MNPDPRPMLAALYAASPASYREVANALGHTDNRAVGRIRQVLLGRVFPHNAEQVRRILDVLRPPKEDRADFVRAYLAWANFPELTKLARIEGTSAGEHYLPTSSGPGKGTPLVGWLRAPSPGRQASARPHQANVPRTAPPSAPHPHPGGSAAEGGPAVDEEGS